MSHQPREQMCENCRKLIPDRELVHECGSCRGSGDCPDCDGPAINEIEAPARHPWERAKPQRILAAGWSNDADWAVRYLRAIYIPAYVPIDDPQRRGPHR